MHKGSHLASLAAAANGEADVAAIECVTLAFAAEHCPELVARLRQIGSTRSLAALPFVALRPTSTSLVTQLRESMRQVLRNDGALRSRLHLEDIDPISVANFQAIVAMAHEARMLGYSALAWTGRAA